MKMDEVNNKDAFERAIASMMGTRTQHPSEYAPDVRFNKLRYVVRMCERLAALCRELGGEGVTVEDVLHRNALAAGHEDYASRLAHCCTELLPQPGPLLR